MAYPAETAYLSFPNPIFKTFQRRTTRPSAAKKSGSSHLFGVVAAQANQTAFVLELLKTVTFLSYVLSW